MLSVPIRGGNNFPCRNIDHKDVKLVLWMLFFVFICFFLLFRIKLKSQHNDKRVTVRNKRIKDHMLVFDEQLTLYCSDEF